MNSSNVFFCIGLKLGVFFFFGGLFAKLIDLFEFREHKYPELDIQQKTEINIYIYIGQQV